MKVKDSVTKHTVFNFIGYVLPILITLVTIPLYITQIGEARFGILSLVWLVLGYFGLFDFGLGKAVTNQIAFYKNNSGESGEKQNAIFWTSTSLNFLLGLVGGAVLYFLGPVILSYLTEVKAGLVQEVLDVLPMLAIAVPIVTLTSVGNGYLEGREEFGLLNFLKVLRDFLFQTAPLAISYIYGPQLIFLIFAAISAKVITSFVLFGAIFSKKLIKKPSITFNLIPKLFNYGGYVTISNIIGPILVSIDRFVIGAVAGAKAVTYYSIPFSISKKLTIITSSLSLSLFPKFSSLEKEDALRIANKTLIFLVSILTPLVILGMLVLEPFLNLWIGPDIAEKSTSVGIILLAGIWINNLAKIPHTLLYGQQRPNIVALFHSLEVIPYLAILWLMVKYWGINGAAFAWTLRVSVDALLLSKAAGLFKTDLTSMIIYFVLIITSFVLLFINTLAGHSTYIYIAILILIITTIYSFHISRDKFSYLGKYFYKNIRQLFDIG